MAKTSRLRKRYVAIFAFLSLPLLLVWNWKITVPLPTSFAFTAWTGQSTSIIKIEYRELSSLGARWIEVSCLLRKISIGLDWRIAIDEESATAQDPKSTQSTGEFRRTGRRTICWSEPNAEDEFLAGQRAPYIVSLLVQSTSTTRRRSTQH